jgi:signal transduction histidine kinase
MAAGMAHEIRNPLGGIQLYASLLAKDLAEQPQSLALVGKIAAGVTRLERVVSQVLQFTREMTAHRRRTDAAEVIDQAVELARPALNAAAVDCDMDGPRPLTVELDPHLLSQAALNLLINAAEAIGSRGQGGQVQVRWSAISPNRLRLSVRDDGPGIPPQALDKICNPFFTTKETGTGLGLAIVHRIVEAHNGAMTVRNAPEGGAEFELTL